MTITKTVEVEVDVDLADIDTDDLIDELESREAEINSRHDWHGLYQLLATNQTNEALARVKEMVQSATGRILP